MNWQNSTGNEASSVTPTGSKGALRARSAVNTKFSVLAMSISSDTADQKERRSNFVKIGTAANVPAAMALAQEDNDRRCSQLDYEIANQS